MVIKCRRRIHLEFNYCKCENENCYGTKKELTKEEPEITPEEEPEISPEEPVLPEEPSEIPVTKG